MFAKAWSALAGSNTEIFGLNLIYSVFMLSCVKVEALWQADTPSKEYFRLCMGLRNLK
jgi:hypothetical protein